MSKEEIEKQHWQKTQAMVKNYKEQLLAMKKVMEEELLNPIRDF